MKKRSLMARLILLLILIICTALPVQATIFSAVTNADQVKIFSEPSPAAAAVEVLKLGDIVKVFDKSDDGQFWQVEHKGHHGWIKVYQLSPKDNRY